MRSIRPALTPSNGYVCLACRLRTPGVNLQARRQQHAATQPSTPGTNTPPLDFKKASPRKSSQGNEELTSLEQGSLEDSENAQPVPATSKLKPRRPSAEAEKLQFLLHEKFVAQRRKDAASMQCAEDIERGPKSREAKAKKRKLRTADKRRGQEQPSKKGKHHAAGAAAKRSIEPKAVGKKSPPSIATSKTSRGVGDVVDSAGEVGEENESPTSSDGPVNMEKSAEVEKTPLADNESGQAEASKPSMLEQLKNRFQGLASAMKAVKAGESAEQQSALQQSPPLKGPDKKKKTRSGESTKVPTPSSSTASSRGKKLARLNNITLPVTKDGNREESETPKIETDLDNFFRRIVSPSIETAEKQTQRRLDKESKLNRARDIQVMNARKLSITALDLEQPPVPRKIVSARIETAENQSQRRLDKESRLKRARDIQVMNARKLSITALDLEQPPVPRLSYGLERVLFNPGVYYLQDPRSRVYNFDPYLQTIMPVKEFDFSALKEYITSSRDTALQLLAESYNKRYVGSSSSMTGILAHFHFLLSQWRPINTNMLSRDFPEHNITEFTELQRIPTAIFLKWRNGSYAIDADKEFQNASVLMLLGKSMEKLLTLETEDFEKYRKSSPYKVPEEERKAPEAYHYSTMGDFIMRSQLDAQDPRLPGTGMFDLKTRAVVSVRMEASNHEEGSGYQIKSRQGAWESFEREYFDMIRSAFLKYSLQVRMGRMDGIFVAFHNTDRIFGFQYVSLPEMDSTLHGQWDTNLGDQEFKLSVALLNEVLNKATQRYPNTSLRLHFETRKARTAFMYIFVEPVTEEQITAIQTAKNAEIQQFEDEMYGNKKSGNEVEGEEQSWENLEADVQDAMDEDIRDPNHEDGRQDLDPKLVSAKQRVLEEGPSADEHNTTVESETEASPAIGMDEDADDEAEEEGEAEDEDAEETAIEAAEDDADDGGTEADEGKEDNEVHHGSSPQVHGEEFDTSGGEETSENRMDGSVTDSEAPIPNEATAANAVDWDSPGNATKNPDATSGDHTGADGSNDVDGREPLAGDASPISGDFASSQSISQDTHSARSGNEVLALTLTIRNMINGRPVLRPVDLKPNEQWAIEYSLDEVPSAERAWSLYQACQMRRRKKLDDDKELRENDDQVTGYIRKLREMSRKGAKWRKEQDEMDKELPVKILGSTVLSGEGDEA